MSGLLVLLLAVCGAAIGGLPVTDIDAWAFARNTSLRTVSIPGSVTGIGRCAFAECTRMASISVDPHNASFTSRNGVLFNKTGDTLVAYPAGLKERQYAIPSGVTAIGDRAFYGCARLRSVSIPDGLTDILEGAFMGCTGLRSVNIPESVTSIGAYAFSIRLTSIRIGAKVKLDYASFDDHFYDYYNDNRKKAGVYTLRTKAWSYAWSYDAQ